MRQRPHCPSPGRKVCRMQCGGNRRPPEPSSGDLTLDKSVLLVRISVLFSQKGVWLSWLNLFWKYLVIFRDMLSTTHRGDKDAVTEWGEKRWQEMENSIQQHFVTWEDIFQSSIWPWTTAEPRKAEGALRKGRLRTTRSLLPTLSCASFLTFSHRFSLHSG